MPRFREIAPAPEPQRQESAQSRSSQDTSSLGPPSDSRSLPPRRTLARKACAHCRMKKIKCSGGEPCFQCQSRQLLEECCYELSQEEALRLENFRLHERIRELELLCRPQHAEAFDNIDIDDVAVSVSGPGPHSGQASLGERLDKEPVSHYSQACPQLIHNLSFEHDQPTQHSPAKSPSAIDTLSRLPPCHLSRQTSTADLEYMLQPHAQLSLANELATRYPSVYPALLHPDAERLGLQVAYDPSTILGHIHAMQLKALSNPKHLDSFSDIRLRSIDLSPWTDVLMNGDVAASLLSQYFDNDHAAFRLFDADLFLDDLAYGGQLYCSPQLLNAVLAWACQAYHGSYPEGALQNLGLQFMAHADHLFWQSLNLNTITSAATGTLLEICAMMSGHAELSARYKTASLAASQSIGLFGSFSTSMIAELDGMGPNSSQWTRATSHTAWGVFSNQTFTDLHSRSCAFRGPPGLPIPGRDTYTSDEGILSILPRSSYTDISYVSECELAVIVHDMVQLYYYTGESDDGTLLSGVSPSRSPSLEQAENLFKRLLSWATSLPFACVRGDQNSPETMFMHMNFHAAVIALFQPFIYGPLQRLTFQSFVTKGSALCAFNSSVDQLKRLVVNHRSTFELSGNLLAPLSGLLALASSLCQNGPSFERKDDSIRQHYFAVCVEGLLRIVSTFQVIKVYIQGLLTLALSTHTITTQYAEWVMSEVTRPGKSQDTDMAAEHLTSNMVVDYELALTDRSSATYDKVAAALGNVNISDGIQSTADVDHVAEDERMEMV